MMPLLLNGLLAAVPAAVILFGLFRSDRGRREPPLLLIKTFLLGFLAVIPAFFLETLLDAASRFVLPVPPVPSLVAAAVRAFLVIALVEEAAKLLVIRWYLSPQHEFEEVSEGMIYTVTAGMGFALFENLLYGLVSPRILVLRALTAVPLHALTAGILGYSAGISRFEGRDRTPSGLTGAVLLHGSYNMLLFAGSWVSFLVFPLLAAAWAVVNGLYRHAGGSDDASGGPRRR